MKSVALIVILVVSTSVFSQTDTCDYIAQSNYLGGLDCYLGSTAPFTADSYQWVNCDDNYSLFVNDTTSGFMNGYVGYVALIIEAAGCIDTSDCFYHCDLGLDELKLHKKELVKIVDVLGKDSEETPGKLLIYLYSDGTSEKVFRVE
jgi:hypothetical protein